MVNWNSSSVQIVNFLLDIQKLAKLIDFLVFRNNVIYHKCTCCPLPWSPFFINTAHTIAKICCRGYLRGCLILFCLTLILVSRFNFTSRWQATSILQLFISHWLWRDGTPLVYCECQWLFAKVSHQRWKTSMMQWKSKMKLHREKLTALINCKLSRK